MNPNDAMHLICGNNYNWLLNLNLIYETVLNGTGSGLLISMLGRVNWFHLTGLVTLLLLMWKWMGLFLRKNHLIRWWGLTFLLNWIGAVTLSQLLKLPWVLILSMKLLFPEVALHLYKSTIRPCMEYSFHVWVGAPSCYLELLDKLQKRICRTFGPSLTASLKPLAHRRNVAS